MLVDVLLGLTFSSVNRLLLFFVLSLSHTCYETDVTLFRLPSIAISNVICLEGRLNIDMEARQQHNVVT